MSSKARFRWSLFKLYIKEKFWFMWDDDRTDHIPLFFLPIYHARVLRWFIFGAYLIILMLTASYEYYFGNKAPFEFVLDLGFVAVVVLAANFILSLVYVIWEDLVRIRRNHKSDTLTIVEVLKSEINFERWCC